MSWYIFTLVTVSFYLIGSHYNNIIKQYVQRRFSKNGKKRTITYMQQSTQYSTVKTWYLLFWQLSILIIQIDWYIIFLYIRSVSSLQSLKINYEPVLKPAIEQSLRHLILSAFWANKNKNWTIVLLPHRSNPVNDSLTDIKDFSPTCLRLINSSTRKLSVGCITMRLKIISIGIVWCDLSVDFSLQGDWYHITCDVCLLRDTRVYAEKSSSRERH